MMAQAKRLRAERLQIMLGQDELVAVDDLRFKKRMPSRASAVRELLKRGLAAEGFCVGDSRCEIGLVRCDRQAAYRRSLVAAKPRRRTHRRVPRLSVGRGLRAGSAGPCFRGRGPVSNSPPVVDRINRANRNERRAARIE
jgi:hypothetical protein